MHRPDGVYSLAGLFLIAAIAHGQTSLSWTDPSPHRTRLITVEEGVQLEVLDWGGKGRPLVLLAGYLTAHAYDEFAPKLKDFAHVYGVTRRGLGGSSRPDSGYSAERSAEDVVKVLEALEVEKPVLAGHSFGGQDLSTIAANYPDRIAGIIYLNSAEDPTLKMSDYGAMPPDLNRLPLAMRKPPSPDKRTLAAYRSWQLRTQGIALPEPELRQLYTVNPDGTLGDYLVPKKVRDAMAAGLKKPEYARIRVPVLAFFAIPADVSQLAQQYGAGTPDERSAVEQKRNFDLAIVKRQMADVQKGVPGARVVELPGANFYIFLSSEAELLREIRPFVAALR